MTYAGEHALRGSGGQFCSFFYAFEIKEGSKEGSMRAGKSKVWVRLRDFVLSSGWSRLLGVSVLTFQRYINPDAQGP